MLDRSEFFKAIRASLFDGRLTDRQVQGIDSLLDAWERLHPTGDTRHLAYILATVYHETGTQMVPVREGFATSDEGARKAVASLYARGKISVNYALPVGGVSYYGRGRVQNTWQRNYQKLQDRLGHPFVKNPDLLLDDKIDAEVTIIGHLEGLWTGKKLSDYFKPGLTDPYNARRIVNGIDKAATIAGYYTKFAQALLVAEAAAARAPQPVPAPAPNRIPVLPFPEPIDIPAVTVWNGMAAALAWFAKFFRKDAA